MHFTQVSNFAVVFWRFIFPFSIPSETGRDWGKLNYKIKSTPRPLNSDPKSVMALSYVIVKSLREWEILPTHENEARMVRQ